MPCWLVYMEGLAFSEEKGEEKEWMGEGGRLEGETGRRGNYNQAWKN